MTTSVIMQDITPLHVAAQNGDLQAAQSLLAHGADVNVKESEVLRLSSYTVKHSLFEGLLSYSVIVYITVSCTYYIYFTPLRSLESSSAWLSRVEPKDGLHCIMLPWMATWTWSSCLCPMVLMLADVDATDYVVGPQQYLS